MRSGQVIRGADLSLRGVKRRSNPESWRLLRSARNDMEGLSALSLS
jgi:hypothetical protein